jgi:hypothetical protein
MTIRHRTSTCCWSRNPRSRSTIPLSITVPPLYVLPDKEVQATVWRCHFLWVGSWTTAKQDVVAGRSGRKGAFVAWLAISGDCKTARQKFLIMPSFQFPQPLLGEGALVIY